uniref:Fibrinogen C-terminal domain-containing protein n=1 Tax=Branchiostoma floridae TaxID=7739 RepID=C3Z338_BRAFL|eukprot:XP_002597065.1 hypothetical protein BRAFLDRAFT_65207 [Branchiostoma floridae]
MRLLRVFVVLTVLQWSVVTGEGRSDPFSLSLCRVWQECVRTAAVDDLSTYPELGTPQAICGDFVEMLEKHGVDCESLLPAGEDDRKDRTGGMLYGNGQSDDPDAPPSVKLGRTNYFEDCAQVHTAYVTLLGHVSSVGAGGYHTLRVGGYSGTAGDGFGTDQPTTSYRYQNGAKFSTRYFDQDASSVSSVAELHGGGWWYRGMAYSNLNGPYFRDTDLRSNNNGMGVLWYQFTDDFSYSLKKTKMMVRPTDFSTRLANN